MIIKFYVLSIDTPWMSKKKEGERGRGFGAPILFREFALVIGGSFRGNFGNLQSHIKTTFNRISKEMCDAFWEFVWSTQDSSETIVSYFWTARRPPWCDEGGGGGSHHTCHAQLLLQKVSCAWPGEELIEAAKVKRKAGFEDLPWLARGRCTKVPKEIWVGVGMLRGRGTT